MKNSVLEKSKVFTNPVNQTQNPGAENAIEDNRAGNGKDFTADSKDLPFCLELNRRRNNRIGKTGDGDNTAGTAELSQFLVYIQAGQQYA